MRICTLASTEPSNAGPAAHTWFAGPQAQLALKRAPLLPQAPQAERGRPGLDPRLQVAQLLHSALSTLLQLLCIAGRPARLAAQARLLAGGGPGATGEGVQV